MNYILHHPWTVIGDLVLAVLVLAFIFILSCIGIAVGIAIQRDRTKCRNIRQSSKIPPQEGQRWHYSPVVGGGPSVIRIGTVDDESVEICWDNGVDSKSLYHRIPKDAWEDERISREMFLCPQ